jgi:hypothetical protein
MQQTLLSTVHAAHAEDVLFLCVFGHIFRKLYSVSYVPKYNDIHVYFMQQTLLSIAQFMLRMYS